MSEEFDEIVDNLKKTSSWVRLLFMVAFAVVLYIVLIPVVIVLTIAQALFAILKGEANPNLRYFGMAIEEYVGQIIRFLAYNSEQKPFPFSDFPKIDEAELEKAFGEMQERQEASEAGDVAADEVTTEDKAPKSAAKKKPSTKKAAAKKKAAKKAVKKAPKKTDKKAAGDSSGETPAQ